MGEEAIFDYGGQITGIVVYKVKDDDFEGIRVEICEGDGWNDPDCMDYYIPKDKAIELAKAILKAMKRV